MTVLRHVAYSATGLNFTSYVPVENPSEYIKARFIRSGSWDTPNRSIHEVGLRFIYSLTQGKINFSIDPGAVVPSNDEETMASIQPVKSVVINANFHRECQSTYPNQVDKILTHLNYASQDESEYLALLHEILLSK